jgi:hypothetical protein
VERELILSHVSAFESLARRVHGPMTIFGIGQNRPPLGLFCAWRNFEAHQTATPRRILTLNRDGKQSINNELTLVDQLPGTRLSPKPIPHSHNTR